ncbi:hypothetical protein [Nonomuraea sp. NPDC002799]
MGFSWAAASAAGAKNQTRADDGGRGYVTQVDLRGGASLEPDGGLRRC